jgi:hypothetical protein
MLWRKRVNKLLDAQIIVPLRYFEWVANLVLVNDASIPSLARLLPSGPYFSSRPEELKDSSDSLSGIFPTHRFSSSCDPPSLTSRRIGTHDFVSPTVKRYTLGSLRSDALIYTDFLFPLSRLQLYRGFSTRDTKLLVLQPPIPDAPKCRYMCGLTFQ